MVNYDVNEPNRRGYLGGLLGGLGSGHGTIKPGECSENREDLINLIILKPPGKTEKDVLARGAGSYCENVRFGKADPIWDVNMKGIKSKFLKPKKASDLGYLILPSDSSKRPDGLAIIKKDWETAEAKKHEMEELQRHDKKLRTAAAERRKQKSLHFCD